MSFPFSAAFRASLGASCRAFPRQAHEGAELRRAAVALALVEADDGSGETAFLLTRRAATLRAHAGQWALPGGRCDPGETAEETAARELEEELGLALPAAHILGTLDDFATRSGYVITPVVAWLEASAAPRLNPAEVASVHHVRLDQIARDDAVAFLPADDGPELLLRLYIGERFIHAPTAAMVYQLRELVAGRVTRVAHLEQPSFAWR